MVLHSSAPGAPRPLCTRSPRDLPVWVGANVPVGLVNGEHMAPVGPRCSGAPTSSSGARARSAAESPGRVHSAVRRAAVSDSSRRISRRVACPAGVGPHRRQPSPMTGVAAATLPAEQHRGHGPVHDGVPGEGRPRRAELGGRGRRRRRGSARRWRSTRRAASQLQRAAEQRGGDPRREHELDVDDHHRDAERAHAAQHEQVPVGDRGDEFRAGLGHGILTLSAAAALVTGPLTRRGRGNRATDRRRGRTRPAGSPPSSRARR